MKQWNNTHITHHTHHTHHIHHTTQQNTHHTTQQNTHHTTQHNTTHNTTHTTHTTHNTNKVQTRLPRVSITHTTHHTHHTSHVTHHSSRITHRTSHIAHHTSCVFLYVSLCSASALEQSLANTMLVDGRSVGGGRGRREVERGWAEVSCRVCPPPCGTFKTSPCVSAKRPRVSNTRVFSRQTREVLNVSTWTFSTLTYKPPTKHQLAAHTPTRMNIHNTILQHTHTTSSHETLAHCCDSSFSVRVVQVVVSVLISTLTSHAGLESYQTQTHLPSQRAQHTCDTCLTLHQQHALQHTAHTLLRTPQHQTPTRCTHTHTHQHAP